VLTTVPNVSVNGRSGNASGWLPETHHCPGPWQWLLSQMGETPLRDLPRSVAGSLAFSAQQLFLEACEAQQRSTPHLFATAAVHFSCVSSERTSFSSAAGGLTPCDRAHSSRWAGDRQQQPAQQSVAERQPQACPSHGKRAPTNCGGAIVKPTVPANRPPMTHTVSPARLNLRSMRTAKSDMRRSLRNT
jgi:hypothetical protein